MFLGQFEYAFDAKGRVAIPVKWRDAFRAGAVVTKGFDANLIAYPKAAFQERVATHAALPSDRPETRDLLRWLYSSSRELDLDAQGRLLVPTDLRGYAHIDRDSVIVGSIHFIEIWSPDLLAERIARVESDPSQMAAAVGAR
jgi:MraZ protein